jgi:hypothetical protein
MYVLQIDAQQRDYLISVLEGRDSYTAAILREQLTGLSDAFGIAMWTDLDVASQLQEEGLPDTPENIRAVRKSYSVRHISDRMIEHGWGVLEEAVCVPGEAVTSKCAKGTCPKPVHREILSPRRRRRLAKTGTRREREHGPIRRSAASGKVNCLAGAEQNKIIRQTLPPSEGP